MKTLVNKDNPQIRITAPEIEVQEESEMYLIPVSDYCIPMCIDDWTLVDEEPENISWADRLKKRLENMTQEEFEKAMNEMYVEGDESPTLEEYLKAAYHSPIETEPVDLEKAAEDCTCVAYIIPQTFEEKVEMYMKCDKKTLAEMLAMRDMIMEHKNPPQEPILTKTK